MSMDIDFLCSERVSKAITLMKKDFTSLEKLEITEDELKQLKEIGFNVVYHENDKKAKINTKSLDNNCIMSLRSPRKIVDVKWVEINDLYIGNKFFAEKDFRYFLDIAKERGYKMIFIAGNITAGHEKYCDQEEFLKFVGPYAQAQEVVRILSDYPCFEYYAINGDSDSSFEKHKQVNPLYIISNELEARGIKFNFIQTYAANFLIEGVVKRVAQIKTSREVYTISYPADKVIRKQFENMLDNVIINDENYKIRFYQFGKITTNTFDMQGNMYATTSSGFLFDKEGVLSRYTTYPSGKLCDAKIRNANVLSFKITNIEMPKALRKRNG